MTSPARPIFFSYSRQDAASAVRLKSMLERRGLTVWIDIDIPAGTAWREAIVSGIRRSLGVVALLSPRANESEPMAKELAIAEEEGRPIVPVVLEPSPLSTRLIYVVAGLERIDCPDGRVDDATADELAEVFTRWHADSLASEGPATVHHPAPQPPRKAPRRSRIQRRHAIVGGAVLLGVLVAVAVGLVVATSKDRSRSAESFDSATLQRWTLDGTPGVTVGPSDGNLRVGFAEDAAAGAIIAGESRLDCDVHGDFVADVAFSVDGDPSDRIGLTLGLGMLGDTVIEWAGGSPTGDYATSYVVDRPNDVAPTFVGTDEHQGRLRLQRRGTTFTGSFLQANGQWIDVDQRVGRSEPAKLALKAWTGDEDFSHQPVRVHFDEFLVSADGLTC